MGMVISTQPDKGETWAWFRVLRGQLHPFLLLGLDSVLVPRVDERCDGRLAVVQNLLAIRLDASAYLGLERGAQGPMAGHAS
jgi:hypothetical protein